MAKIEKALVLPVHRQGRIPGQVPSKAALEVLRLATKPPRKQVDPLDHGDRVRLTPQHVVAGLGLGTKKEAEWATFVRRAVDPQVDELGVRRALQDKLIESRLDPSLRRALLQRSLRYYRDLRSRLPEGTLKKAGIRALPGGEEVVVYELVKAQARGGAYHRRTPRPGGGYRYFYDQDKYERHPGAHVGGPEAKRARVAKALADRAAGGCEVTSLKDLARKFGVEDVLAEIRDGVKNGRLNYANGRLRTPRKRRLDK